MRLLTGRSLRSGGLTIIVSLLLKYGVGVLTPENTLTLRYNLTEKFYVEAAQSVESALDFFYTFDF